MPEVKVSIGGRDYAVACQPGEEVFLRSAAAMLDAETAALGGQAARLPETRLLLMAGLLLADKTAGMEDQLRALEARLAESEAALSDLRSRPAPTPLRERVEVPVVPEALIATLRSLSDRAEGLAAEAESRSPAP